MKKTIIPEVFPFYDKQTSNFSYIVKDPDCGACAVIDSVLNLDYQPSDREVEYLTGVAKECANNIHAHDGITEDQFVDIRETPDATLNMPGLILPSLQVNMLAGHFPPSENNDIVYLKVPINAL